MKSYQFFLFFFGFSITNQVLILCFIVLLFLAVFFIVSKETTKKLFFILNRFQFSTEIIFSSFLNKVINNTILLRVTNLFLISKTLVTRLFIGFTTLISLFLISFIFTYLFSLYFVDANFSGLLIYKIFVFMVIYCIIFIFIMITKKEIEFSKIYSRTRFSFFLINFGISIFYGVSIFNIVENLLGSYSFLFYTILVLLVFIMLLKIPSKEGIFLLKVFLKEMHISFIFLFLFGFLTLNIKVGNVSLEPLFGLLTYLGVYVSYCGGDESPKPFEKGTSDPSKTTGRTWKDCAIQTISSPLIRQSVDRLNIKEDLPGLEVRVELMPAINAWYCNGAAKSVLLLEPSIKLDESTKDHLKSFEKRDKEATNQAFGFVTQNTNYLYKRGCIHLIKDLKECAYAGGASRLANFDPVASMVEYGLKVQKPSALPLFLAVKKGDHTASINQAHANLDYCMRGTEWVVRQDSYDDF